MKRELVSKNCEFVYPILCFTTRYAKIRKMNLERDLKRWEHKEGINEKDPPGCGFPICVDVDMRPKRFASMCSFVRWLKDNGHERRIFAVQKGGCEDVSKLRYQIMNQDFRPRF